jgi:hypothetical protein
MEEDNSNEVSVSKKLNLSWKFLLIYFLIFIIVLGGIVLILSNKSIPLMKICGDGTFYGDCSLSKPYFCEEGVLIESVEKCLCPGNLFRENDSCNSEYFNESKEIILNYIFNGEEKFFNLTFYGGVVDYLDSLSRSINYGANELPQRRDFKLLKIENELQKHLLMPLVVAIQNSVSDSKEDQARIAVSLVQNIPYLEPENVSVFGGKYNLRVSRYPYQTIYELAGSCEGKSELLLFLLKEIGYGISLFYYPSENHEAVGIKCPIEESFENSGYCFIETTMPSLISYSEGRYLGILGSNKLFGIPEIILINDGLSLEKNLIEYRDARHLTKIVNKIDQTGRINYFEKRKFDELRERYGLLY